MTILRHHLPSKTDEQTITARRSQQDDDEAYVSSREVASGEMAATRTTASSSGPGQAVADIPLELMYQLAADGFDMTAYCGSSRRIPAREKPAVREIIVVHDSDDGSTNVPKRAPVNDIDFNAFIDGVQESVCDPDKVYVVLNDIPSKKRRDFSEPIVLKYKDLQKGVPKQEVKEYLKYINSQKYIDGKKFIAWVDVKKDLLKNYEERCDQFSGNKTLLC